MVPDHGESRFALYAGIDGKTHAKNEDRSDKSWHLGAYQVKHEGTSRPAPGANAQMRVEGRVKDGALITILQDRPTARRFAQNKPASAALLHQQCHAKQLRQFDEVCKSYI